MRVHFSSRVPSIYFLLFGRVSRMDLKTTLLLVNLSATTTKKVVYHKCDLVHSWAFLTRQDTVLVTWESLHFVSWFQHKPKSYTSNRLTSFEMWPLSISKVDNNYLHIRFDVVFHIRFYVVFHWAVYKSCLQEVQACWWLFCKRVTSQVTSPTSLYLCNKCVFSLIILLQLRWPIESTFSCWVTQGETTGLWQ